MELILSLLRKGEAAISLAGCHGDVRWNVIDDRWSCTLNDGEKDYWGYGKLRHTAIREAFKRLTEGQAVTA